MLPCSSRCDWPSFRTRITTCCCSLSQADSSRGAHDDAQQHEIDAEMQEEVRFSTHELLRALKMMKQTVDPVALENVRERW